MSPYHRARPHCSANDGSAHSRVACFLAKLARRSVRRGACPSTLIEAAA